MNEDLKISQLPQMEKLTGREIIPVVIDGLNRSVKFTLIAEMMTYLVDGAIGNSMAKLDELNNMIV